MKRKVFFPNLDGLRTIAFLGVFISHSFYSNIQTVTANPIYQRVKEVATFGRLGVNLFFILSGFLITYLLLTEEEENKGIDLNYFYLRRLLRIWPLYFACVAFGLIAEPFLQNLLRKEVVGYTDPILYLTFLGNLNNAYANTVNSDTLVILWSVCIEEQFYLFWPILLIFFRNNRIIVGVIIIVLSVIFRYYHSDDLRLLYHHTFSVISDLAIGAISAIFAFNSAAFVERVKGVSREIIVVIYIIGFCFIFFADQIFNSAVYTSLQRVILSIFFVFVILEQNYSANSFYKMKNNKIMSTVGKYTYGLYCLHMISIIISRYICSKLSMNENLAGVLIGETLFSLLISLLLSFISYHFFESHFLKVKERFAYIIK